MDYRRVEFEGGSVRIARDQGTDYVSLQDCVSILGLRWQNENQRARDKFDAKTCVMPVSDVMSSKKSVCTVIQFELLETYLHGFNDRHGGFKPPQGFYHKLARMITNLPTMIFESSPDFSRPKPDIEEIEKNFGLNGNGVESDVSDITEEEYLEASSEVKDEFNKEQEDAEIQALADQFAEEAVQESAEAEDINEELETDDTAEKIPQEESDEALANAFREATANQESEKQLKPQSYTAFPMSDGFKSNIDNMIQSTELFIEALEDFQRSLEELRESQFVMLKN